MTGTAGHALAKPGLERLLRREIEGDVLFDRFSRGRYATDASIYQMMPIGVVVPKKPKPILKRQSDWPERRAFPFWRGVAARRQCGQTVNNALVIDNSKYFNDLLELDVENRRCVVRPGIVLDELNRALKPHGLWFPVDVSTASRATIGGMAAVITRAGGDP